MEKIKQIIEQFEDSKLFIKRDSINNYRIALILIDNIVELMLKDVSDKKLSSNAMNSRLNATLKQYYSIEDLKKKGIVLEELSNQQIKKIKYGFPAKVNYLMDEGYFDKIISDCILELHEMRNTTYHHGVVKKDTVYVFALLYYNIACGIFEKITPESIGSDDKEDEFIYLRYGIKNCLDLFHGGMKIIANSLLSDMNLDKDYFSKTLKESISNYRNKIDDAMDFLIENSNYKNKEDHYKVATFLVKESNYPKIEELEKIISDIDDKKIEDWLSLANKWNEEECVENIFLKYIELEKSIIKYVVAFDTMAVDLDSAIQLESDIARGK